MTTELMERPDAPAPLATLPEPTIGAILQSAVASGMDPAGLEKLAAIYERELARRAAIDYTAALTAFSSACPSVAKNREAVDKSNKVMYRYADLEHVTRLVRPLLFSFGFRYSWDTEIAGDKTTIVCHLIHTGGHRESSRFTARGTGTSIMSGAQIEASVMTFGQRRTLLAVLGLSIDDDDDGRGQPNPAPPADPASPRVGTREQGHAPQPPDNGPPRVTTMMLGNLYDGWKGKGGTPHTIGAFSEWVVKTCGFNCAPVTLGGVPGWNTDMVEACRQAIHEMPKGAREVSRG